MPDNPTPSQSEQLFTAVYGELRGLAAAHLRKGHAAQSLSATGLVHEAFVKLVKPDDQARWETRTHFFSAATQAMRHILVDRARKRLSLKRGGDRERIDVNLQEIGPAEGKLSDARLIELDDALRTLAKDYPIEAELVQLRYFGGLTFEEVGQNLDMSESSVRRKWAFAKAKLLQLMGS